MLLVPALVKVGRGRCISEFETSLVYRASLRIARDIQKSSVSKQTKRMS